MARGLRWCVLAVVFAGCDGPTRPGTQGTLIGAEPEPYDGSVTDSEVSVSVDAGDGTADVGADVTRDVGADAAMEAGADATNDLASDIVGEASEVFDEAPVDAVVDVLADALADAPLDNGCPSRRVVCGGECVDTSVDARNCGSCGTSCATSEHATPACSGGACSFVCESAFGDCDGDSSNGCETGLLTNVEHCGACMTRCAGRPCVAGVCVVQPSRLIAPLTGSVVSRMPVLRWLPAAGTDGARVEFCPTRSCTGRTDSFTAGPSSGSPPMPLAPGRYFWRVIARTGSSEAMTPSETWSFSVGRSSGDVDALATGVYDSNGDGAADVAIGATEINVTIPGRRNAGRAHVFSWGPDGPTGDIASSVSPSGEYGNYGASVASAGDVNGDGYSDLLVSAPLAPMSEGDGRVYVIPGGPMGTSGTTVTPLVNIEAHSAFGTSADSAGDVNADGYGDVIVGAPGRATSYGAPTSQGYAYLYLGSATGLSATPAMSLTNGSTDRGAYGTSVAAGDLNGDGRQDLVVGAGLSGDWDGSVYVYLQPAMGFVFASPPSPSAVLRGTSTLRSGGGTTGQGEQFGARVVAANFNSDRFADLVVTAPGGDNTAGVYGSGRVYVYLGREDWTSRTPTGILYGPSVAGTRFANAICGNGDLDADGYADLVVGAFSDDRERGRVYVYRGGATGIADRALPAWTIPSPGGPGGAFGVALGIGGDLNRDNVADLVVGAPGLGIGGKIYAYYGDSGGLPSIPSENVDNPIGGSGSAFGQAVW